MADQSKPEHVQDERASEPEPQAKLQRTVTKDDSPGITLLDGLRIIFGLLLLSSLVSYFVTGDSFIWGYKAWWTRPKALVAKLRGPVVLTDGALLAFDGHDESRPIYLALNGTIYDVSANPRIYGPGGMYNVFAGRDAARGFVTGCFAEDNVPDLRGVEWMFVPVDVPTYEEKSDAQLESSLMREYRAEKVTRGKAEVEGTLKHWAKVFRGETGKDYFEIGYVDRKSGYWAQKPARKLCANAEKKRPKAQFEDWIQQRRIGRAQKEKEERDGKKKDEL